MRELSLLAFRHLYAWVIAGAVFTAGGLLLATPDSFRTKSLHVAFEVFPPQTWGWMFLASVASFALFHRRRAAAAPMAFVVTTWASMLAWSSLTIDGASPISWVWPTCIAVVMLLGIARGDL